MPNRSSTSSGHCNIISSFEADHLCLVNSCSNVICSNVRKASRVQLPVSRYSNIFTFPHLYFPGVSSVYFYFYIKFSEPTSKLQKFKVREGDGIMTICKSVTTL